MSDHPPEALDELFAAYLDRLNAGETLDPLQVLYEQPRLGPALLEKLESFVELTREPPESESASDGQVLGTLGDYTLRRQIGRGGMGVVYEAWQNSLDRRVALKVLPAGIAADDKTFHRFMREARTTARLNHTNIVGVHGVGIEQATPYYAMELVEGETLAQILARITTADDDADTPFGPKTRQDFFVRLGAAFAEVADGLQHAHSKGVIHRDIKPSNLILNGDGRLRILDFGLARLEGQESLTHSGDFVGTPAYMSPEQARRRKIPVDHRTDVYSLGATMYEALTGEAPFRGTDHADTLSQILERDPRPPRQVNPRVPVDLETIVLKCLRKNAADRYGTAEALEQDLRRFARGDSVEARPESSLDRLARQLRRHKSVLAIIVTLLAVMVAGIRLDFERRSAERRRDEAERREMDASYDAKVHRAVVAIYGGRLSLSSSESRLWGMLGERHVRFFSAWGRDAFSDFVEVESTKAIQKAAEDLAKLVGGVPERIGARYHLSRAYLALGRIEDAQKQLRTLVARSPEFMPARLLLCESAYGSHADRRAELDRIVAEFKGRDDWSGLWLEAFLEEKSRNWQRAINAYTELLDFGEHGREPYVGFALDLYLQRGLTRMQAKEYWGAQEDFASVLTLAPGFLEGSLLLGMAYYLAGEKGEAEKRFRRLLQRAASSEKADTAVWILGTYDSLRDYRAAEAWLPHVSEHPLRERFVSLIQQRLGDIQAALEAARRAAARFPRDLSSQLDLAAMLAQDLRSGNDADRELRIDELVRAAKRAADLDSENGAPRHFLAFAEDEREYADLSISISRSQAVRHVTYGLMTLGMAAGLGPVSTTAQNVSPRFEWISYLGGPGYDAARAVAVGPDGSIYLGGSTDQQTTFPRGQDGVTLGDLGDWDVVIAKLSPDGSELLWTAVLGGPGLDVLFGIDVDANGVVTISGRAADGFPRTTDREHGGQEDAFVAQLDPNATAGDSLRYSTFLGGWGEDVAVGVAVHGDDVTIVGYTGSANFPATTGALQEEYQGGAFDLFVARLTQVEETLNLTYATFLGTVGDDLQTPVDTGPSGDGPRYHQIHMVGVKDGTVAIATQSLNSGLPTLENAYRPRHSGPEGASDVYVAQIDPSAAKEEQLVYGSYLGTPGWDAAEDIAVDEDGAFLVSAYSWSAAFPLTANAFSRRFAGNREATLSVLDPRYEGRDQLTYSTFLGGSGNEYNGGIVPLPGKLALLSGHSSSTDFPVTDESVLGGGVADSPLALFDLNEKSDTYGQLLWSTYVGGRAEDYFKRVALAPDGSLIAAGYSASPGLGTDAAFQPSLGGSGDMWVCKLNLETFRRGDCNGDATIDIADAISTLGSLFLGQGDLDCDDACDADDSGTVDIADPVFLLSALFAGGNAPPAPLSKCGLDPTIDDLTCDSFDGCR